MRFHLSILLSFALLAASLPFLDGCLTEQDYHAISSAVRDSGLLPASEDRAEPVVSPAPAAPAEDPLLVYRFGGFDGSRAAETHDAQIASLRVTSSGLTYKWTRGGCEALGASSRTAADCLACVFYRDGSQYIGGKFDWISTSRLSRDFKNIDTSYGGWDSSAFHRASSYAFCVVSRDGKRRTNIITVSYE